MLSKERYCYKIHTLLIKSSAYAPYYRQPLYMRPPTWFELAKKIVSRERELEPAAGTKTIGFLQCKNAFLQYLFWKKKKCFWLIYWKLIKSIDEHLIFFLSLLIFILIQFYHYQSWLQLIAKFKWSTVDCLTALLHHLHLPRIFQNSLF